MARAGQQPIGVGVNAVNLSDLQRQGLGLNVRSVDTPDGANVAMGGGGCGCLVNRAPHPNAARLYLNWLLSREGQTLWVRNIIGHNSRRLDVEIGDPKSALQPGVDYVVFSREEHQHVREEATRIAKDDASLMPLAAPADLVRVDDGLISARVFADPDVYQLELERVFGRTWLFVAHESEIPRRGDFVTRVMGEDPVIVVRGADGEVRVLLNVCRHRGRKLCGARRGAHRHLPLWLPWLDVRHATAR